MAIADTRVCTRCGWTIESTGCGCGPRDKAKPLPPGAWRTIPDPEADPVMAARIIALAERLARSREGRGLAAGPLLWRAYWKLQGCT